MSFLKKLWNGIANLFRSQKAVMQIAIEEAALTLFKSNPSMKVPVVNAINSTLSGLSLSSSVNVSALPSIITSKIDISKMDPQQQIIVGPALDQFILSVSSQISDYMKIQNITSSAQQVSTVSEVLGWIKTVAMM